MLLASRFLPDHGPGMGTVAPTAFEMMTSRPPNPSTASCTILSQSVSFPTSWPSCQMLIRCMKGRKNRERYALDQDRLGLILFLYLPGNLFCSVLTRIIIYGQVTTFSSKLLRYQCAQAPTDFDRSM